MSEKRHVKKIDLSALDAAERKLSAGKLKKVIIAFVLLLALSGGGYAAYRVVTGEVVASRFAVDKMNCPACVVTVTEVTEKLPGVVGTRVSLAAKDVTVSFRDKQTNPDEIRNAITGAGYPASLDGVFREDGSGVSERVIATVNGKPVFEKEVGLQFDVLSMDKTPPDQVSAFFTAIGKEILLQAADKETVVVQPFEIEQEVDKIIQRRGMNKEEFLAAMKTAYGSSEKYNQIVGQRLGIRRFLDDYALNGIADSGEKNRRTMELVGKLFNAADVQIVDVNVREKLHAAAGQGEWKTFWPRMIGSHTALKSLLTE
jgi:copper chaperone CopZ